ncbi:GntR family transcriptional regulator [Leucobacter iarius]|uniref:GntR family transcriptional regulator n=1 Tax=Leucobacter iarius TaxID=333963 RepID=A0ABN2L8Z7_9MICO
MPAPTTRRPVAKRRLLKDEAHDAIQAAILDGTFAPGEKLDDQALTQWLGISRSPIREALNLLASEGFVEIQAQSSTSVVTPDPEQIEYATQALGVLVGGALQLAIPAFTEAERAETVRLIEAGLLSVERRDAREYYSVMGVGFAEYVIAHCPNPIVAGIAGNSVPALVFRIRIAGDLRTPNWDLLASGWTRVRFAVLEGDLESAERAFAELYRLPLASAEWAPAQWAESRG